jgi:hypothetical protein
MRRDGYIHIFLYKADGCEDWPYHADQREKLLAYEDICQKMRVLHEVMTEEGLDLIGPLWLELRQMHRARSTHFKSALGSKSFEERREELLEKAAGGLMRVELARNDDGWVVV